MDFDELLEAAAEITVCDDGGGMVVVGVSLIERAGSGSQIVSQ